MDRKPHGTAEFVIKGLIHLEALACFSVAISGKKIEIYFSH